MTISLYMHCYEVMSSTGENVTANVLTISDVPRGHLLAGLDKLKIEGLNQSIEVRGEVISIIYSFE